MKKRILISTGGSGGHVVPAMIFFKHLENDFETFMTSDLRGSKFIEKKEKLKIINILPLTNKNFNFTLEDFCFHKSNFAVIFFYKKGENRYHNFHWWIYVSSNLPKC